MLLLCIVTAGTAMTAQAKSIDHALLAKANAGDADAQYHLGNAYNYGRNVRQDYAQALNWYRKSAEQGNADAEYQLGGLYHFGHGVPQDDVQGFAWIMKAAEHQNAVAEHFISVCYGEGWGVPKDNAHRYFWLRRAAEDGNSSSQYLLGWAYGDGFLVMRQDQAKAYFWLDLSASGDLTRKERKDAIKRRNIAASHLSSAELSAAQEQVRQWKVDHSDESE